MWCVDGKKRKKFMIFHLAYLVLCPLVTNAYERTKWDKWNGNTRKEEKKKYKKLQNLLMILFMINYVSPMIRINDFIPLWPCLCFVTFYFILIFCDLFFSLLFISFITFMRKQFVWTFLVTNMFFILFTVAISSFYLLLDLNRWDLWDIINKKLCFSKKNSNNSSFFYVWLLNYLPKKVVWTNE